MDVKAEKETETEEDHECGNDEGDLLMDTGTKKGQLAFDIAHLDRIYGPGQRGATAVREFQAGNCIQAEVALAYVSSQLPSGSGGGGGDQWNFFSGSNRTKTRPYDLQPPELSHPAWPLPGGLYVALTGILIRDHSDWSRLVTEPDGEWTLFGEVDSKRYAPAAAAYEMAKRLYFPAGRGGNVVVVTVTNEAGEETKEEQRTEEEDAFWTLEHFARLYGVVQVNSMAGVVPFSTDVYGVGMYPGSVFFNHACQPNAAAFVLPSKVLVHALRRIEEGEEITIAYQELPLELLSPNMVRTLHLLSGQIRNPLGCRCEICREHLDTEAVALERAGQDPNQGRDVILDMIEMWEKGTKKRFELDQRLRAYVATMMQDSDNMKGVVASHVLRTEYEHFLTPPAAGEALGDFCVDMAYLLSDIYCRSTIHVEGQTADNYLWWTGLYGKVLARSVINMPHSMTMSLAARGYAYLQACALARDKEEKVQRELLEGFIETWIAMRMAHIHLFRHPLFTVLVCEAYPLIRAAVVTCQERIRQVELQANVNMALPPQSRAGPRDPQ
jgi:hypothetical protein